METENRIKCCSQEWLCLLGHLKLISSSSEEKWGLRFLLVCRGPTEDVLL